MSSHSEGVPRDPDDCRLKISSPNKKDARAWAKRLGKGYTPCLCGKCGEYHFDYTGPPIGSKQAA